MIAAHQLQLVVPAYQQLDRPMSPTTPDGDRVSCETPEALIEAIAELRDRAAFACLFDLFAPRLKAFLLRQGAGLGQAEDLVQDVMLTLWRRAAQFDRNKASASTWIFTIARNRRIDVFRRERRPEFDPTDPLLVPDQPAAPDDAVVAVEAETRLRSAIAELPEEQAELVRLSFFEDKSHSVIADETRLPLGTVKSRIRLALARLRILMEQEA